MISKRHF